MVAYFPKYGFRRRLTATALISSALLLGLGNSTVFADPGGAAFSPTSVNPVRASELGDPAVVPGPDGTTQVWGTADYYLSYDRLDEHHVGTAREQSIEIRRADGSIVSGPGGRFWDLTPHDFVITGKKVRLIIAGGTLTDDFAAGNPGRRLHVLVSKGFRNGVERLQVLDGPVVGVDNSGWGDHMYGHVLRTHADGSLWIAHEKRYEKDGHAVTEIWEDRIKLPLRFDGKRNPLRVTGESRRLLETPLNADTVRAGGNDYLLEGLREVNLPVHQGAGAPPRTETLGFVAAKDFPTDNYPLYVTEANPDPHATSDLRLARDAAGKLIDLSGMIREQVRSETGLNLSWGPSRGEPKLLKSQLPNGKTRILLYFHGLNTNEITAAGISWDSSTWPKHDLADFNRGIYSIQVDLSRDAAGHLEVALVPHTFRTIRPSWVNLDKLRPPGQILR